MDNKYDAVMRRIGFYHILKGDHAPISASDVNLFEADIGYPLPGDYKEFLLNYGLTAGRGITRFSNLDDPNQEETSVEVFYGLRPGDSRDLRNIRDGFGDDLPAHLLPIASSPG